MMTRPRVLPFLIPLAVAGCATQQSVTDQTAPMQDRMVQLEAAWRAADEASRARDEAMNREIAALRADLVALSGRVAGLNGRLDGVAGQATRLDDRLGQAEKRLDGLAASVKEALALAAQENIRINGREAFAVLLTEDKTLYPINSPELGGQDIAKLDDLVRRLAGLEQEYHLEIQGHTDNIGTEDYNYELGKARADVVKRFLHEQRGISLSRMSVISYGAGLPLDGPGNRSRRINVRVLVLKSVK